MHSKSLFTETRARLCGVSRFLASEELKSRAWRYHKQYLTWFQRALEPNAISTLAEDYETGS